MVSSETSSDRRHRSRRSHRSRERDRSRSGSRERTRHRSWDKDYKAGRDSRSHSRSHSRDYRSRSRSRGRYHYHSPDRNDGYDRYADHHYDRDPPSTRWVPGAGCTGHPAGELFPWRARGSWDGGRHMDDRWDAERDGDYAQHPGHRERPAGEGWPGSHCSPRYHPDDRHHSDDRDYEYDDRDSGWARRPHSRERSYGHSRGGSDTDRDWDMQREIDWQRRYKEKENPTASIFIKGLPEDAEEADIYKLFEGYPNIQSVKVLRDRMSGRSRGSAFVDFAHVDDARLLMDCEQRWTLSLRGHSLLLDYSHGSASRSATAPGEAAQAPAQDWICDMCSAVNFARRLECYHCYTARPSNPRRVVSDLNEPSHILKISGLEPSTSEEVLFQFCAAVVPNIIDLRVIKDKYTGAPRGFAFVECGSISEAGSLMLACQGHVLPGQATPLKICYAKAKERLLGAAEEAAAAAAAVAPEAAATAGPLGWKPKEFDASAVLDDKAASNGSAQPQEHASGAAEVAGTASEARFTGDQQQQQEATGTTPAVTRNAAASMQASGSEAAAAAGVDAATIQALTQAGFEYQPSSGYWYDAKSGYYYDAKTQLYYHHSTGQWYKYDHSTGQYTSVTEGQQQQQQQQPQQQQPQQQQPHQQQQAVAGSVCQPEQPQQQRQKQQLSDADKRRRAAVIGSAPQYNREGLLAAAALAKEKEEEKNRIAAAKAARERQQQQQNRGTNKQQLMPGKPGIGALPIVSVSAAVPAAAAHVVADGGNVQGVVYKSKWAQRQQR